LHRHTCGCSRTDRLRFFLAYRQEKRLSPESKRMLAIITRPKASRSLPGGKLSPAVLVKSGNQTS
jgi:hypothetical protein